MSARDEILDRLRGALERTDRHFPPQSTQPLSAATRMTVTSALGDRQALAKRFGAELAKLHGSFEILESPAEARMAVMARLQSWQEEELASRKGPRPISGQERSVLTWPPESLPIPGIDTALADLGYTCVSPPTLYTAESREAVRHIRFGITGAEAAFASTGSILVGTGAQSSRVASLLPFRHIALIPLARLYPTLEDWLHEQREANTLVDYFRARSNVAMISGPSKSADIEMILTLGVHGPKFLHAILFEDK